MASEKRVGSVGHAEKTSLPPQKRLKEEADVKSPVLRRAERSATEDPQSKQSSPARAGTVSQEADSAASGPQNAKIETETLDLKSQTPKVDVDLIVCNLKNPEGGADVMRLHANELTAHKQVQAYAKLAGRGWTYYVQKLEIVIGRSATDSKETVDIDLAPSKIVSRRHAVIRYNLTSRTWEIVTFGRNGLRLDNNLLRSGITANLSSGCVVDVGNMQMMFVLPDAEPVVAPVFIEKIQELRNTNNSVRSTTAQDSNGSALCESQPPAYPNGVTIVSRPQVPSMDFFVQELSNDECKDIKPPFSYATMIAQAILSTSEHKMTLADIYSWISSHYAFYRHSKPGWQNSIRHNLSLNKAFEKAPRKENESGKGSKWYIVENYKEELIRKATTGRQHKGAYIPRKPYDDSPSPHGRQMGSEAQGQASNQQNTMNTVTGRTVGPNHNNVSSMTGTSNLNESQVGHSLQQIPNQQAPNHFSGNMQMVPQQGFQMPMGYQQMNGNFPGVPYMPPYGVPYYSPQPGQSMLPVVPPLSAQQVSGHQQNQHHHQQPQHTQSVTSAQMPNQYSNQLSPGHQHQQPQHQEAQHQSKLEGTHLQPLQQTSSQHDSERSQKSQQSTQLADQTQLTEVLQAGVQLASENLHLVMSNSEQRSAVNPELQTPARQAKQFSTRDEDSNGENMVLGSAVKVLSAPGSGPPESSPALWKYMNLESTPNNNLHNQKPGGDPDSSPPGPVQSHSETRKNVNEPMPLIDKWERGKA